MASRKQRSKESVRARQKKRARAEKAERLRDRAAASDAYGAGDDEGADPRLIDAMTVAWMLSLTACLLAEFGAVAGAVVLWSWGDADQAPSMVGLIPFVLAFTALITGTCCLGLTYLVLKIRPVRPPAPIVRTALVAGLLPWLGLAMAWLAQAAG